MKKIFFLLLIFSFSKSLFAQLVADFSADNLKGCAPLTVRFSDNSSGGTIIYRRWIFTPAAQSVGNNVQPINTFTAAGNYTISLTVSDGIDTVTTSKPAFIEVFANPVASFTAIAPTSGCAPLEVQFTDNSSAGTAPISNFQYTFGDGSVSANNPNPIHNYLQNGNFSVTLQISDTNGCNASFTRNQYIQVDKPIAEFTSPNPPHSCRAPLNVQFLNQSQSSTAATFSWHFGNGDSSNAVSPTYIYTNPGIYTVQLIITDARGCKDSLIRPDFVSIAPPLASITSFKDTVCVGELMAFNNGSQGLNQFNWTFGDGNSSSAFEPEHTFLSPGIMPVKLVGNAGPNCTDSTVKLIRVEEVIADFSTSPTYSCEFPSIINYTDLSQGDISNWYWFLSLNDDEFFIQNPSITYQGPGNSDDMLVVTSPRGCTDTLIKPNNVALFALSPVISASALNGCFPLDVQFQDLTQPVDSVVAWHWDFDNGDTSNLQNPFYTFTTQGEFTVRLTVTTPSGCSFENSLKISTGAKPIADFNADTLISCAFDSLQFNDLSISSSGIDEWFWDFGDNIGTSTLQSPQYQYQDVGLMQVSLVVSSAGCKDTIVKPNYIEILGPIADFDFNFACDSPKTFHFSANYQSGNRFKWNFGGLFNADSTNLQKTVTFPYTGDFNVVFTAYNDTNNCIWKKKKNVRVRQVQADFTASAEIGCAPLVVSFNGLSSVDYAAGEFYWDMGNGETESIMPRQVARYFDNGSYNVQLVIFDVNGCSDTTFKEIRVFKPEADFSLDTNRGCLPFSVQFTDQSISDTSISSWSWFFGNGQNSSQQNPLNTYTKLGTGVYTVALEVQDALGCKSFIQKPNVLRVFQPLFSLSGSKKLCENQTVAYSNFLHENSYQYQWQFSNGFQSNLANPQVPFPSSGLYDISVTVTDTLGCDSVFAQSDFIDIQAKPQAQVIADITDTSCYPAQIRFTEISSNPVVHKWYWNFGNGDPQILTTDTFASVVYNYPGEYSLFVWLETTYGCRDTLILSDFINIGGPFAQFSLDRDTACARQNLLFQLDSAYQVSNYQWTFADGFDTSVSVSTEIIPYAYQNAGIFSPTVVYVDSSGQCPKFFSDTVFVDDVRSDFLISKEKDCIPFRPNFSEQSSNATNFIWQFDSLASALGANANYRFRQSGIFEISLVSINEATGCADTIMKTVEAWPLPYLKVLNQRVICEGDSLQLTATGAKKYTWFPYKYMDFDTLTSPIIYPPSDINYTVIGVDSNLCRDTIQASIEVENYPPFTIQQDTIIFLGESFNAHLYAPGKLAVKWTTHPALSCTSCKEPLVSPNTDQFFSVRINDLFGCFTIDTAFFVKVIDEHHIYIPNAFTPNNDGLNDILEYKTYGIKNLISFQIFDRTGRLVFETDDLEKFWDGNFKSENSQNSNVFVYMAVFEKFSGEKVHHRGVVSIIK